MAELLSSVEILEQEGNLEAEVLDVTDDSRMVRGGSVFVAMKGEKTDGHEHIGNAVIQGAVGIVLDRPIQSIRQMVSGAAQSIGVVRVQNSRATLGMLASQFHHHPSEHLQLIGVTGTNGKTTVTHLIKALLESGGQKVGVMGTVGSFIGPEYFSATHTTPGPVELQGFLAKMVASHINAAVLEVSSHALTLDRVKGCDFDLVVFTNLTQDHLDFHGTMEEYFHAKRRLFTEYISGPDLKDRPKRAIINIDDEWGRRLRESCQVPVWTYSLCSSADIRAKDISLTLQGSEFKAETPNGEISVRSPLVGEQNVYNILAAVGAGLAAGITPDCIQQGLASFENVPGRFERLELEEGQDFTVIVDYAHTEDALARLLSVADTVKTGRIITVFGCGGDRDPGKRPQMGRVAAEKSDRVFLTSDNPRSEDPLAILQDIEHGFLTVPQVSRAKYRIIPDRGEAIWAAVKEARSNDIVLIAGKGHEDYQLIGAQRLHFDDREIAREALRTLIGKRL